MNSSPLIPSDLFTEKSIETKPFKNHKLKRFIYKLLFPKQVREKMALDAKNNTALRTAKNWRYLINQYDDGNLEFFSIKPKVDLGTDKIIWQYWGQGTNIDEVPEVVKISFNSVDRYKGDYKVIRLDDESIKKYIDLPDFVWQKKGNNNFRLVFFSDLLRLALLEAYGGIWIDATIVLTSAISPNILDKNFFVFQRDPKNQEKEIWYDFDPSYFNWDSTHLVKILSSFMVAKKNNQVIHIWLDLLLNYWKTQDSIYHYFFFQILFEELMVNDLYKMRGEIIDDTLPHLLQKNMYAPYSAEKYQEITNKSAIHKLTYPKKRIPGSFYDHLANTYL